MLSVDLALKGHAELFTDGRHDSRTRRAVARASTPASGRSARRTAISRLPPWEAMAEKKSRVNH